MSRKEKYFIKAVWEFYREHKRGDLPWRKTRNPYHILVSEVMLQQTQVQRVIPKYEAFLKAFPTIEDLSKGSLATVLKLWQGLGYNRRAKALHAAAKMVMTTYDGVFPTTYEDLLHLPGVGPYTAGAISAFAYNQPIPLIETNVRTVYLHHFFKHQENVSDREIAALVQKTIDGERPREWFWALMDYGSYLKKEHGNLNHQAKAYAKQSAFAGSDRQIRGTIIRLLGEAVATRSTLQQALKQFEAIRIDAQLEKLLAEGMIAKTRKTYHLPK